jgi:hypothetical protein
VVMMVTGVRSLRMTPSPQDREVCNALSGNHCSLVRFLVRFSKTFRGAEAGKGFHAKGAERSCFSAPSA